MSAVEHFVVLASVDFVMKGDTVTGQPRGTTAAEYLRRATDRRRFLEALLKVEWMPSEIRSAVAKELGFSLRQKKRDYELGFADMARHLINEAKQNGRSKKSELEKIAKGRGMSVGALKKLLARHP
jgi:hypothetical protein